MGVSPDEQERESTTPFLRFDNLYYSEEERIMEQQDSPHTEEGSLAQPRRRPLPHNALDDHQTTVGQTFVHLVKGYIGPGCLSLPWAMSQLGIIPGVLICFILATWSSYNCWIVVQLKRKLMATAPTSFGAGPAAAQQSSPPRQLTYPDVAGSVYGPTAQTITAIAIGTQQLAICTVFFSFCGDNLQAVLNAVIQTHVNPDHPGFSHATVISFCFPIVLSLAMIPDLKRLASASAVGTVLLMIGFGILGLLVLQEWGDRPSYVPETGFPYFNTSRVSQYPLAACALLYSYEGICLILPIESAMRQPQHFGRTFGTAMLVAALTFSTVASLAVFVFGSISDGSLTAFLLDHYEQVGAPQELIWLLWIANAVVSLSVLVTYPLQLFPALELVQEAMDDWKGPRFSPLESHSDAVLVATTTPDRIRSSSSIGSNDDNEPHSVMDSGQVDDEHSLDLVPQTASPALNDENVDAVQEDDFVDEPDDRTALEDGLDGGGDNDHTHYAALSTRRQPKYSVGLRLALVLFTYVFAVVIPNVQSMIALAGALAGSLTALIVPPALAIGEAAGGAGSNDHGRRQRRSMVGSQISLIFGILFGTVGTVAAVLDILKSE